MQDKNTTNLPGKKRWGYGWTCGVIRTIPGADVSFLVLLEVGAG